jgi:hypothetical protein
MLNETKEICGACRWEVLKTLKTYILPSGGHTTLFLDRNLLGALAMSDGTTFWSLLKKKTNHEQKIVKHGKRTQHFFHGTQKTWCHAKNNGVCGMNLVKK